MSIFKDFEIIKKEIGAEKYNMIEKYLDTICTSEDIEKYFEELKTICKLPPKNMSEKSEELKKKFGVILLNDVLYKPVEWVKFDNWYNENIKHRKVRIINYWYRDFGDIGVNALLYEHGKEVANIAESYEEDYIEANIGDMDSLLTDNLMKKSLENLLYVDFDNYLKLPKITECSNLLRSIYDDVYSSDSEMCHIDYSDWDEFYKEEYSEKDINRLKEEIKKYNLEKVLEVDNGEYKILGYSDLIMNFNDDRYLNKEANIDKIVNQEYEL